MKTLLRAACFTALAAVTFALPLSQTSAQDSNMEPKPAVVISLSSIDQQNADVRHLMKAAGMEAIGDVAVGMAELYTEHLNKEMPIGGYVTLEDSNPQVVMFVPVTDLDAMLEMFSDEIGDVEEGDGGVKIISTPQSDLFIKESGGFAFVTNMEDNLDMLPTAPAELLKGLNDEYNFAIRVYAQNVPNELKQMAIGFMDEGFADAVAQMEAIDPEAADFQRKMNEVSKQSMVELIEQTDEVTIGLAIDEESSSTYIDFMVTGLPDSKLAKQSAVAGDVQSKFGGFLTGDPAASLHFASKMSEEDMVAVESMMVGMRDQVMAQIADEESLSAEQIELAQDVAGQMLDVLKATMETGVMDGGAKLVMDEETVAFAAGMGVAEGTKIEDAAKRLVEAAKADAPPEVEFNLDAETYKGIDMHVITIPVPEDEEEMRNTVGDTVTVVLGTSEDAFYLAAGKNAISLLKSSIDSSMQVSMEEYPVSQFNISLSKVMSFAASVDEDPIAVMLADMLEGSENDKIRIVGTLIENGSKSRIEIQDDVIKLLGTAGMQFGGGAGPGF